METGLEGMDTGLLAGIMAVIGAYIVFVLIVTAILIVSQWIIYTKAGKPGWACLIPIYNIIVLLEIIGKPWWWLILMLIPFVNFIIAIWMTNLLSKSFGKGAGFTLGLLFLPVIFYPILAFSSAKYVGPAGK